MAAPGVLWFSTERHLLACNLSSPTTSLGRVSANAKQIVPNSVLPGAGLGRCSKPRGQLTSLFNSHQTSHLPSSKAALNNPVR